MTDLSHDLRISREALAAAERRADEAERALAAMREIVSDLQYLDSGEVAHVAGCVRGMYGLGKCSERCRRVAAALSSPIGSGWLSPEQGVEMRKALEATRRELRLCARQLDSLGRTSQPCGSVMTAIAQADRALAAHPTEEAKS